MSSHRPICTACGREMKCVKNGYIIGYELGRRYDSDRFECDECGASVALLAAEPHPEPMDGRKPVEPDCMVKED